MENIYHPKIQNPTKITCKNKGELKISSKKQKLTQNGITDLNVEPKL